MKITFWSNHSAVTVTDLFRSGHEVNGSVVLVIFLKQTEGELVINQQVICSDRNPIVIHHISHHHGPHHAIHCHVNGWKFPFKEHHERAARIHSYNKEGYFEELHESSVTLIALN